MNIGILANASAIMGSQRENPNPVLPEALRLLGSKKSETRISSEASVLGQSETKMLNPKLEIPAFVPQGGTSRRQAKL
jgi:hypothetical protein